jgi:ubiquinone/menaquinone biosynthesis C-methylase UbiE
MLSLERQNEFRERYRLANPGWQPATERYANLVRAHLRPGSTVLDLGCGRGGLVEQLRHPLSLITGVDSDEQSLRQHRLEAFARAAAVADALPFQPAYFDLVFSSWLLEHLPNPDHTLREIGRVLRPNGFFIFITPNKRHPLSLLNRVAGRLGKWQRRLVEQLYGRASVDTFPTWYRANTPADLQHLSNRSNLIVAHLEYIADPSYLAFSETTFQLAQRIEQRVPLNRHIHLVGVLQKVT